MLQSIIDKIARDGLSVREVKGLLEAKDTHTECGPGEKRARDPSHPCTWQEGKRDGSWTFKVNYDPGKLRNNPENLREMAGEIAKVLKMIEQCIAKAE